ncbi:MAG TPA: ferritin family protein [Methanofastidiosum sp.]|nr:ferritin family protein [Methanofastidiosum sp.]HOG73303.1 ferritin family protein [Methanofastidiosum sp.]HPA48667.1 ferritin family protein [Methanofastidiosum sp.]HQM94365.1 ferritin family protein [Methanofastidiosum sp.]
MPTGINLGMYSTKDLILTSIKSEIDSRAAYLKIKESVKNAVLKDKMNFLANEEEKHRIYFEGFFKKSYPGESIKIPDRSPVPLPEIKVDDETMPISEVLQQAMNAEVAAYNFYQKFSLRFKEQKEIYNMLNYIADMEMGHFRLLEIEKENSERFESYDDSWPMMHAGP